MTLSEKERENESEIEKNEGTKDTLFLTELDTTTAPELDTYT